MVIKLKSSKHYIELRFYFYIVIDRPLKRSYSYWTSIIYSVRILVVWFGWGDAQRDKAGVFQLYFFFIYIPRLFFSLLRRERYELTTKMIFVNYYALLLSINIHWKNDWTALSAALDMCRQKLELIEIRWNPEFCSLTEVKCFVDLRNVVGGIHLTNN